MGKKRQDADADTVGREERRESVARMYLQGYAMFPIAKLLDVSIQTVSRDLERIRKQWLESRNQSYDEKMMKELIGIEMQESQLWEAWYRSCQLETIRTVTSKKQLQEIDTSTNKRKKGRKKSTNDRETAMVIVEENEKTVTRQGIGDPRFMSEITRLRELRCKLLGLLEDEKPTSPIVNIWQQLQEMHFDRDRDEIEDRINAVKQLPPINQVINRPTDDKGLKDASGWKDIPSDNDKVNGFKELDKDKIIPSDDTPLDIE